MVTGLPFTSASGTNQNVAQSLRIQNITFADFPHSFIGTNTTTIRLGECTNAGAETDLLDTDFANNSILMVAGLYRV